MLSNAVRFRVLFRDEFTCRYCRRSSPEVALEIDHVRPRSIGGTDDDTNLVTACYDCNRGKRDLVGVRAPALPMPEWMQQAWTLESEMRAKSLQPIASCQCEELSAACPIHYCDVCECNISAFQQCACEQNGAEG